MSDREKRNKQVSFYLTESEEKELLALIANLPGKDKAKCGLEAMKMWMKMHTNPPESVVQARYEAIMHEDNAMVKGFICGMGHAFWLSWSWPSPPRSCPCCGDKLIKRTWIGITHKGTE